MKISMRTIAAALVLSMGLSGCVTNGMGMKEGVGTVAGAAGGAWLGSTIGKKGSTGNIIAIAVGTLGGAAIGGGIGASLDKIDQMHAEQSAQAALERNPDGQATGWSNPNTGHSGYTVPTATYEANGTYCREYQTTVVIDGTEQKAYGTACRQPDGSWKVQG